MQKIVIIGAGFGGLAAACLLGKAGYEVTVLEKNDQLGGRAGLLEAGGFTFDTGPSWYLMPDVFEQFFGLLDEKLEDHITLKKLSPSYRVFYKDLDQQVDMTGDLKQDVATFESIEPGAGNQLKKYLTRSEYVYNTSIQKFLHKNYDSLRDFMQPDLMKHGLQMKLFSKMDPYVKQYFKDPRLQKIMEYPLVFLGASPYNAPALYNLMSHVDFNQGVFYPMGGMYTLVEALVNIGKKYGVKYQTNTAVEQIIIATGKTTGVKAGGHTYAADIVVSDADPHHTETALLAPNQRDHSEKYWQSRTMAPSALLMYLGVDKQYESLLHHNLLFCKDWKTNFTEIFDTAEFPSDPSLYVCAPSKTDPSVAPAGKENLFVLVPLAAGLTYSQEQLEVYADKILATMEKEMHLPDLRKHLIYKKLFCADDFAVTYNSYKGTGLGLAHTLMQTALFRPSNKSKKVQNLFYVGANVSPGIGLPITLISAELLYKRLTNDKSSAPLTHL